jgi:hypothetical protein
MSFKNKKAASNSQDLNKSVDTEDQAIVDGFWLYYYEADTPNQYKPMSLLFHHPHSETCREWITQIAAQIQCKLLRYPFFSNIFVKLTHRFKIYTHQDTF